MVGAAESTVSPSSSRTSRSTPCVLGCWGPMLTVIVSARISGIRTAPRFHRRHRPFVSFVTFVSLLSSYPRCRPSTPREPILRDACPELLLGDLQRLGGARRHPNLDRIILAQRIPFPVLRHQQPPRVRVAVE